MAESCSYTETISAKDGNLIPMRGAVAFHSKYNPLREAEQFAAQFDGDAAPVFFVVFGLCGGYHVKALAERFQDCTILAVENTAEDIAFLKKIPCVQELAQCERIVFSTAGEVCADLRNHFVPAAFSAIKMVSLRSWELQFAEEARKLKEMLKYELECISADFSVQSHFGGIWQRNIFANLALASQFEHKTVRLPVEKTAAIIAAGPSLDDSIALLQKNRSKYHIIATDTGYRALLRRGIVGDVVVCVDAQMVSHNHFFDMRPETLCVLDASTNPAIARKIAEQNTVVFAETGHPLSSFASQWASPDGGFLHLTAGSGTVTIAAADFAIQAGFKRLAFFGADFAYSKGKAYAKGTYLDDLYNMHSTRTRTAETTFDALLFRTELIGKGRGTSTTPLLDSYRESLENFLKVNNFLKKADNEYIHAEKNGLSEAGAGNQAEISVRAFDGKAFSKVYETELKSVLAGKINRKATAFITLLPFIAWLKRKYAGVEDFAEICRLACNKTLEFNKLYEN